MAGRVDANEGSQVMSNAIIRIVDLVTVPGREGVLAVIEFIAGSGSDLSRSTLFSASDSQGMWQLNNLAHSDPPQTNHESGSFVRVAGTGNLRAGMELEQVSNVHQDRCEPLHFEEQKR